MLPIITKSAATPAAKKETWDYLRGLRDIRKHLCFGCRYSKLYDKNNKEYLINHHTATVEEVMAIVEEIKKVNEL